MTYEIKEVPVILAKTKFYPMFKAHWEETASNKATMELDIDWELFKQLQASNSLLAIAAFDEGKPVGYLCDIIQASPHNKGKLLAINDVVYVTPEHRKGSLGKELITTAERLLNSRGVSIRVQPMTNHCNFGRLLDFLDYTKEEVHFFKFVGDN